ncbi:MAG: cytosolic protein [Desulfobacteraceae bacterium]|nr:cytosolic protein [Desulfobacteraceae bacterium]
MVDSNTDSAKLPFDLSKEERSKFILNMFNRIIVHYSLWFTEVRHQMGMDKALEVLETATQRGLSIQMKKLSEVLGFDQKDGIPDALLQMDNDKSSELMKVIAKNWLVNDGVWFQAVEFDRGMNDAKRCNDSCWAQFSPYEAGSISTFLNLGESPGLDGLKKALGFRMYSMINKQSIVNETDNSFEFQMNECRVQVARKRKELDDYPCKSGGLVEYAYFARAIDKRIKTECIACPPDDHPMDWYCAWRFSIDSSET